MSVTFKGVVGAPGIAIGPVAVVVPRATLDTPGRVAGEHSTARLRHAQAEVARRLEQLAAELRRAGKPDEAGIFDAQALLATDTALASEAEQRLQSGAASLEAAVSQATDALAAQLAALDDAYLRERAADVRAVGQQLVQVLSGAEVEQELPGGAIVLAEELTPTQVMALQRRGMRGFATLRGAPTGHVALLARALEVPALLGLDDSLLLTTDASEAILVASAERYRADHPAVLRLIRETVQTARHLGLEVSLCGELAADPAASVALVGLGLDKLSMAPPALLPVKAALQSVTLDQARHQADLACGLLPVDDSADV